MVSQAVKLGNLVRLVPLTVNDLPPHPAFANGDTDLLNTDQQRLSERPSLITFIKAVFSEAISFIDYTVPTTFISVSQKKSPPATSKVALLKHCYGVSELENIPWNTAEIPRSVDYANIRGMGESWVARSSKHANKSEEGTANWLEFKNVLKVDHSEKERHYTPEIFDSLKVLEWDSQIEGLDFGPDYKEVDMRIYEMCHKLPFPLAPRVFSVLVLTAITGDASFIDVQIPIDIHTLSQAFYSNGRNLREGMSSIERRKPVIGTYVSVERCRVLPDSDIQWLMASTSDAGGWLPMWIQKIALPSILAKDVGFVMKWTAQQRHS